RDAEENDEDPGVSRRPAWNGDYFGSSPAECAGNRGETYRGSARGVQWERRGGHCVRGTLCAAGSEAREHFHGGHERRDLRGPGRGDEPVQGAVRAENEVAHAGGSGEGRGRVHRIVCKGRVHARDATNDGGTADRVCHGEPRSRDYL